MKPMKRSAAHSADRSRGAAAATAAGRLRVAAVLCSLLTVALWLSGCEIPREFDFDPKVTVTAETALRQAGKPLEFAVRVDPAPTKEMIFHVEIDAAGCDLPEQLRQSRTVRIAAGVEEVTLTLPTDGIDIGAEGCTFTVMVTEGDSDESATQTLHFTVLITLPDPPAVTVAAGTSPVEEGGDVSFTLTATPAPLAPLTVAVSWSETGSFLTGTGAETVTIPPSGTATVSASTADDSTDEADGTVTLAVESGDGYTVGMPATASVTVTDDDVPAVSVAADMSPVTEGTDVSFTLTATPAPAAPLTVAVSWSEEGSFLTGTGPATVTIPTSGTATVSASTADDGTDEADGTVTLSVESGDGYTVGTPATASVTVTDSDVPAVSVAAGPSPVTEGTDVEFTLTATPAPAAPLPVRGELVGEGFLPDRHAPERGDDPHFRDGHGIRVHRERPHRRSERHGDAQRGKRRRLHGRYAGHGVRHRDGQRCPGGGRPAGESPGGERHSGHFPGGRKGRRCRSGSLQRRRRRRL